MTDRTKRRLLLAGLVCVNLAIFGAKELWKAVAA